MYIIPLKKLSQVLMCANLPLGFLSTYCFLVWFTTSCPAKSFSLSLIHILMVPVFIVQVIYYANTGNEYFRAIAILAFALAASGDAVDGYIARHYNQRSQLGAVLDPLADKLLLVSAVILLSLRNNRHLTHLPIWLVIIILSLSLIHI